jgi:hypothetical protein
MVRRNVNTPQQREYADNHTSVPDVSPDRKAQSVSLWVSRIAGTSARAAMNENAANSGVGVII